jgi:hypothetical protein
MFSLQIQIQTHGSMYCPYKFNKTAQGSLLQVAPSYMVSFLQAHSLIYEAECNITSCIPGG